MSIIAKMYVRLQKLGISPPGSQLTSRDSRIPHYSLSGPLGKLDIDGCPIHSVIVSRLRRAGEYEKDDFTLMYVVPNPRIVLGFRNVQLHSVRVKSFSLFRHVKAVEWRKSDIGLHLRNRLSEVNFIDATLAAAGKDFRVIAHPNN